MAFRSGGSPLAEMQRLETLHQRDPQSAANLVANGKLLVEWARDGRLRELHCALDHMSEERVLLFYSVRMFRVACLTRRLDVLRFMLANGFDLQQACMRDVLHSVVEAIEDHASADATQPLIRFLLDAGVDVNWQRKSDLTTALHIACRRNFYCIAHLLILYDADVNAVAANDEMPLLSAERIALLGRAASPDDVHENERLVSLLLSCSARRSWRSSMDNAPPAGERDSAASERRPLEGPATWQPRVLGFSGATAHCAISVSRPLVGEEELVQAFVEGIQLDTPPSGW